MSKCPDNRWLEHSRGQKLCPRELVAQAACPAGGGEVPGIHGNTQEPPKSASSTWPREVGKCCLGRVPRAAAFARSPSVQDGCFLSTRQTARTDRCERFVGWGRGLILDAEGQIYSRFWSWETGEKEK